MSPPYPGDGHRYQEHFRAFHPVRAAGRHIAGRTPTLCACGFQADALQTCVDSDGDHPSGTSAGTGTWTLGGPETLDPYQDLELRYAPYGEHLQSWRAQDDKIVYEFSDTDSGGVCFFERE